MIDGKTPGVETKEIVSYLPERTYLDENQKIEETLDFFRRFL
jgi:ABC-2 type transport system ATP-binding protein